MKTLLVATDFSPAATNAVNYAMELTKYFNAKLVLLNAYQVPLGGYDSLQPLEMMSVLQDSSNTALQKLKEEVITKMGYDPGIEVVSGVGPLLPLLKETCEKHGAELLVMGIVGEAGKIKEHLIGSTAVEVAKDLQVPLFIIPEKCNYSPIHKIAYACDLQNLEDSVLLHARSFSEAFKASMEVITVKTSAAMVDEKAKQVLEERLKTISHKALELEDNNVAETLMIYSQLNQPDLLLLNPKKHSLFHKILHESVTKKVAFHSNVPVLIIHG